MKTKLMTKIVALLLIFSMLPIAGAGCGTDLESMILEILEEWADAHDVNPSTVGGAANLAKRTASGSTGDEQADAAIGLVKTAKDIQEGDKLLAEGEALQAAGKLDEAGQKMDEAIKKRPMDWSYRVSRASVAYQDNNGSLGYAHMRQAWGAAGYRATYNPNTEHYDYTIAPGYNKSTLIEFHSRTIDDLESSAIDVPNMAGQTQIYYYAELAEAYDARAKLTGSESDSAMAEDYRARSGDFNVLQD